MGARKRAKRKKPVLGSLKPSCLQCGHKAARWPEYMVVPPFCTKRCASFYGLINADHARFCGIHRHWWSNDTRNRCDRCLAESPHYVAEPVSLPVVTRGEVKEFLPSAVTESSLPPLPVPTGGSLSLTGIVRSLIGQVARVAWGTWGKRIQDAEKVDLYSPSGAAWNT